MPRLVSPEEALERAKDLPDDDSPREAIATRVPVKLWRAIAEYAAKRKLRDMSSAYRAVLEEWHQGQQLKKKASLDTFSTSELAKVLKSRGLVIINANEVTKALGRQLLRFKGRTQKALDVIYDRPKVLRAVERLREDLTV